MATIFGEAACPGCGIATRFAEEIPIGTAEELLLLGSCIENEPNGIHKSSGQAPCDYCEKEFFVYTSIIEGIVSGFASNKELLPLKAAVANIGIENEKGKKVAQFNESWTIPFEEQPQLPGVTIKIKQAKWKVVESYKKENVEPDMIIRTSINVGDEYWYKVTNGSHTKWISVIDSSSDNAKISMEPPVVKENEILHEVQDSSCKSEILFVNETEESMTLTGINMLSGTMLLLHSKDEDGNIELEANIFANSLQEAFDQLEGIYAHQ